MNKMYAGKASEAWRHIGTCLDSDNSEWLFFSKAQKHTADWKTYKIVANGLAQSKANYWTTRNSVDGSVGFSMDYFYMREKRPALYDQVESIIKN